MTRQTGRKYDWDADGEVTPPIDRHSVLKHEVYVEYLLRYLRTVSQGQARKVRMTIVDAFSGGGVYLANGREVPGSSIRLLTAALDAARLLPEWNHLKVDLELQFLFADERPAYVRRLERELRRAGFGPRIGIDIHLFTGEFTKVLPDLVRRAAGFVAGGKSFWVLDQYAWGDVPLPSLKEAFSSVPKAEFLLTFNADLLLRRLADNSIVRAGLARAIPGFNLDRVLALQASSRGWRSVVQHGLHELILRESGALFYTPFFVASESGPDAYWLVHLSRHHVRARDVMTQVHWKFANKSLHYGGDGLDMLPLRSLETLLGYDPAADFGPDQIAFGFDDRAEVRMMRALREDVPRLVYDGVREAMPAFHLYSMIANRIPGSAEQFRRVLTQAHVDGSLVVRGRGGGRKRGLGEGAVVQEHDLIEANRQVRVFGRPPGPEVPAAAPAMVPTPPPGGGSAGA